MRTLFDYYLYIFKLKKKESFFALVDLTILVFSWITGLSNLSLQIIFSLSVIKIGYKLYKLTLKLKKYKSWNTMALKEEKRAYSKFQLNKKEQQQKFKIITVHPHSSKPQGAMYSALINEYLLKNHTFKLGPSCQIFNV